ncbi:MAG: CNT family concentrative nucleoside transporter [Paraglaciecola psychrophila]|jgi:CNT family concentrative nucleoside transporter
MSIFQPLLGLCVFLGITFLLSKNRGAVSPLRVAIGVFSQVAIALLLLKVSIISDALMGLNKAVSALQSATNQAAQYMFGYVAGGPTPFDTTNPENAFIIAFQVLPLILVVTVLSAMLFHFGILSLLVEAIGKLLRKAFGLSGALGLGAAATIFFGTIEAPLVIKPYLNRLSRGELLALIVCSMSTIAGSVIILYASVLEQTLPGSLQHLLTASLISVPAALTLAHIYLPTTASELDVSGITRSEKTWIEVALDAVDDSVKMIISIAAIIIVLFAFIYLLDDFLSVLHPDFSLGAIFSFVLRPVMWLVGFDWEKAALAGELMGTKIVLNEFVSYLALADVTSFSPKETIVIAYALCGFANIASCGIIIAGLVALLPERRKEVVEVTFTALFLGNVATLMTGCVVSLML